MNSTKHPGFPPPLQKRTRPTGYRIAMVCTTAVLLSGVAGFLVISEKSGKNPSHETAEGGSARKSGSTELSHGKAVKTDRARQAAVPVVDFASTNGPVSGAGEARRSGRLHEMTPAPALEAWRAGTPKPFDQGWTWPFPPDARPANLLPGQGGDRFALAGANGLATQAEVDALIAGLENALTALEQNLIQQVFGDALPLVGNALSVAAATPGASPLHHLTGLKTAIKNGLSTLTGAPTYTKAQVEAAITSALSSAGITFGAITMDASNATDLKIFFNT
ncbi:MAG TPA: hypothetical protein VHM91_03095, partial [Verrucomicrobiales bacterium]|nr:hypothetical protein [Verrucomicrobiales bacterium]